MAWLDFTRFLFPFFCLPVFTCLLVCWNRWIRRRRRRRRLAREGRRRDLDTRRTVFFSETSRK